MRIVYQNGVVLTLNTKVHAEKMAFRRSDYFFLNCDIVHCALENGADLCVNEDQYVSEYRVSLAERKKERRRRKVDF